VATATRPAHGFHSTWTLVDGVRVHARAVPTPRGGRPPVVLGARTRGVPPVPDAHRTAPRTAARQIARSLRDFLREDPLQALILARDVLDAGPARMWATLRAALRDPIETKLARLTVPTLVLRGAVERSSQPAGRGRRPP
jgi:hypothetical protein